MSKRYNEKEQLKKKTIKIMKSKRIFMDELRKRRSSTDCEKIWRDSHKRLYRMLAEHQSLSNGVALHFEKIKMSI